MKVLMLKYRSINTQDIAEKLLFWCDKESAIVDKFTNFLTFGEFKETDFSNLGPMSLDTFMNLRSKPRTKFAQALDAINVFLANNREFIFVDDYDVWNLDETLNSIIHKSLLVLRDKKHGSPFVDNEDVPVEIHNLNGRENDTTVHERWSYVLDEMIFAFDSNNDMFAEDSTVESRTVIRERINNGRRLFAKYYDGLWD